MASATLKAMDAIMTKTRWTEDEVRFLKNNYQTMTKMELSESLNKSFHSVGKKLGRMYSAGLEKKHPLSANRHRINREKLLSESHDAYYLMGFIAADGNVYENRVTIRIKDKDRQILEDISSWLEFSGPIQEESRVGFVPINTTMICFSVKEYRERLSIFGITSNKSRSIRLKNTIPEEYVGSFVRGIFDGDGTVCRTRDNSFVINICSKSKGFMEDLQSLIGIGSVFTNKNDIHFLNIRSYEKRQFYELLYDKPHSLRLERKHIRMKDAYEYKPRQRWKHRRRNIVGQFQG